MPQIYISIGSNINREHYIRSGIKALESAFGKITTSPVYESISVGFEGENFYNLAAVFDTSLSIEQVNRIFNDIEDAHDRDRSGPRFSSRTLDIDLLLYGDLVSEKDCVLPRPEIYKNAFVLKPLADIAGDKVDPVKNETYDRLWQSFTLVNDQKLWEVPFDLNG